MNNHDDHHNPQPGKKRLICAPPIARMGTSVPNPEHDLIKALNADTVMMMGDNPALPRMPKNPTLIDFFKLRCESTAFQHLLQSARLAMKAGHEEKIILSCLLHDLAIGCLVRCDHGYWGAQMIAPYVSEEIAWAVKYHQALRYVPDEAVGYSYPESYTHFFGDTYSPPEYIRKDAEEARQHRWYMSARAITLYDAYSFEEGVDVAIEDFSDIIGRHFKQPEDGLGFDGSPAAHMWRTILWPNNFL